MSEPAVDPHLAEPPRVLVAIPAHNEAASIGRCLGSVARALTTAKLACDITSATLAVVAHRCTDSTAETARAAMTATPWLTTWVVESGRDATVGDMRTRLVRRVLTRGQMSDPAQHWLFSTDADSTVPPEWVTEMLAAARCDRAVLVAGLVALDDWNAAEQAQARYADMVAAGLTQDGHRHVYAANLAVRVDAFLAAGGFPALPHGEEHGLLAAVRAQGGRVATPLAPVVLTSARMPGRARGGLGELLRTLASERP